MSEFKLPELGEGVNEGELVQWFVKPGDKIAHDEPIAEIMTDKATMEIPSPLTGVIKSIHGKPGDIIQVGDLLITLESTGEASASASASTPVQSNSKSNSKENSRTTLDGGSRAGLSVATGAMATVSSQNFLGTVTPPPAGGHVLASPGTRRLAREMGVDINQVRGTGPIGRVTRDDVVHNQGGTMTSTSISTNTTTRGSANEGTPNMSIPRPSYQSNMGSAEERVPLIGIRRKIAEKMQMSKHIVPHFSLMDEANVTDLVEMREKLKSKMEKEGIRITYLPFIMKALIATMRDFPKFNASIDDASQEIVYKKYFNIGFAADTDQGLVVPVIKNADLKSILEISKEIIELSNKARAGKLSIDEMRGGTISITNIGSIGGAYATPIINHPEVAILGMYKISDKPLWQNGQWVPIKSMNISVTADHRLIDGAEAAKFLKSFIERLENPGRLMLDLA